MTQVKKNRAVGFAISPESYFLNQVWWKTRSNDKIQYFLEAGQSVLPTPYIALHISSALCPPGLSSNKLIKKRCPPAHPKYIIVTSTVNNMA